MPETVPGPIGVTERYAGQDCSSLVRQLSEKIKQIVDSEVKKAENDAKKAQKDAEARKAGGFWDKITSGPINEYDAKVQEVLTDAQDVGQAKQSMWDRFYNYLDMGQTYLDATTDLVSGVVSNVVNEFDVVNQLTEAAGLGSIQPSGQSGECESTLLVGAAGALVRVAKTAVTNAMSGVFAAQATVGLCLGALPQIYSGLMSMPAGALSILLTNKKAILDRLRSTIEHTMKIVVEMTDDDYPFDHRAQILELKARLEEADDDLAQVERTLEAGGKFLEEEWDRAENEIEEVAEELLGPLGQFFNATKIIKLLGYKKSIESLIAILDQRQGAFAEVLSFLGQFQQTFSSSIKFDNLMAPIVENIRCALQQIIGDMADTADINAILKYYVKKKRWYVQLWGIKIFMANTGNMADSLNSSAFGDNKLNKTANKLSSEIQAGQDLFSGAESYNVLTSLLGNFARQLNKKMVRNMDPKGLINLAEAINREIDRLQSSDSSLEEVLQRFNGVMGSDPDAVAVVQLVAGFADLLQDQGLDGMVDSLLKGDLKGFFTDAAQGAIEQVARQTVGDLVRCCVDNAGDGDVSDRLTRMNRTLQALSSAKEVYDEYTEGYIGKYLDDTYKKTIPDLQRMKSDVARVGRAKCLNKGETGDVGGLLGATNLTLF